MVVMFAEDQDRGNGESNDRALLEHGSGEA